MARPTRRTVHEPQTVRHFHDGDWWAVVATTTARCELSAARGQFASSKIRVCNGGVRDSIHQYTVLAKQHCPYLAWVPHTAIEAGCLQCSRSYHAFRFVLEEGVPIVYGRVHGRENSPWSGDHNGKGWPIFLRRPPRLRDVPLEPHVGLRDFRDIVKRVNHFTNLWQDYLTLSDGGADTPYMERLRHALRWWPRFLQEHRRTFGQAGDECTLVVDAPAPGSTAALACLPDSGGQVYRPRVIYCRCVRAAALPRGPWLRGLCAVRGVAIALVSTPDVLVAGRSQAHSKPADGRCILDITTGPMAVFSTKRTGHSTRTGTLGRAQSLPWPCTTTTP